jgi:CRP-like cAMP-binding protein
MQFYTIVEGEALVSKILESGEEKDITHIYPGDFFGEMVLIYGGERVANVTAVGKTVCVSLSRKSFEKFPTIRYFLILQKVPLLSACSQEVRLEIVSKLKAATYKKVRPDREFLPPTHTPWCCRTTMSCARAILELRFT